MYIFVGTTALLLLYYILFLMWIIRGIRRVKKSTIPFTHELPSVSIVIPVRNEEANLPALIRSLESQNYPHEKLEVIFVNDNSTDNTIDVIKALKVGFTLKVLSLTAGNSSKKEAITYGVGQAKGEIIVGSDADCSFDKNWIKIVAQQYDDRTGMVTGPVTYAQEKRFFSRLQQLELMGLSLCGAGLIGNNHPVICSGANISYRRELFNKLGGFNSEENLTSGDDELLMHKIFYNAGYKVKFMFSPDGLVQTRANEGFKQFFQQRRRWASKGPHYRFSTILLLLPLFLFFLTCFIFISMGFFYTEVFLSFGGILFFCKSLADYLVLRQGVPLYIKRISLVDLFAAELLHPLYIIYSVVFGVFFGFVWKERTFKK